MAGATISVRLASPRIFNSLMSRPAMMVLPAPGIVRQQEPDARHLQEVVVDRLKLVRQRIDTGDGQREVGIVLVGQPQPGSLDADAEPRGIAVERLLLGRGLQVSDLAGRQDPLVNLPCPLPRAHDLDHVAEYRHNQHLDGLWQRRPTHNDTLLEL